MRFTMVGRLSECLLLSYRTPVESVAHLLPVGLSLMTRDSSAFWNIVACGIDRMRPKGFPAALGISYHHVAYRLYVEAQTESGLIQGLFFVRSDADNRLICSTGNLVSDFRFHHARIRLDSNDSGIRLEVDGAAPARLVTEHDANYPTTQLPDYLKYQPLGLSIHGNRLRIAEVGRDEFRWQESTVRVVESNWGYLKSIGQNDIHLERATRVTPIDYAWTLGRTERVRK